MSVNKERLQLAIDALRSNYYNQGKGFLCTLDTYGFSQWCPLGVLTHTAKLNGCPIEVEQSEETTEDKQKVVLFDKIATCLPKRVMRFYGFIHSIPEVNYNGSMKPITGLNDIEQLSFKQFADLLQNTYIKE